MEKPKQYTDEELNKMHWRDRWEVEAEKERYAFEQESSDQLVERVRTGRVGNYYMLWHVIGDKCTLKEAGMALWEFIRDTPGEKEMLYRYHCAAALFKIMGMPDPACRNELRKRVQWAHDGEEVRQESLVELKEVIETLLNSQGEA